MPKRRKMKRRDFIRKTAGVSIAAGVSPYIMAGNSKMLTSQAVINSRRAS
jgi:hypothetical protein